MSELLRYIRLGIQAFDFFNYDGYQIKYRPLTSMEFDECESIAFTEVDDKLVKLIMMIRLKDIKLENELNELDDELYKRIQRFYNLLDYNIVYKSIKDFMPEDFSIQDVEKMRFVHQLAKKVLSISSASDDKIIDEVYNTEGKILATIVYNLHQPLVSELWKMTPVQHKFLIHSHPNAPKKVADNWDDFVKKVENGEVLLNVGK